MAGNPRVRIEARDRRFVAAEGFENHPVAESTWRGARDYCAWRGARLPSEVEWEAVARGKKDRMYPWGDSLPSEDLVYAGYPSGVTVAVGSRPHGATPEGILDMAGSLAEWTTSLFMPYPYHADDGREDQTSPGERVTRGGRLRLRYRTGQTHGFLSEWIFASPTERSSTYRLSLCSMARLNESIANFYTCDDCDALRKHSAFFVLFIYQFHRALLENV